MDQDKLPKNWVRARVGQLYNIVGGGTPSTNITKYWAGRIPWITSADIYGLKDIKSRKQITNAAVENSATNLVPAGSIIVVTRVGLGKVALTKTSMCFSQDSQALVGNDMLFPDYSLYYLSQAVQIFRYEHRGTTIGGVTKKQLSELPYPLPPLAEQQRIVAKIEELFSQLDAGIEALKKVRAELKRYRQAVLKYAFEGKLTEEWRRKNPPIPIAILRGDGSLAPLSKEGKKEFVDLPELPEGWHYRKLKELLKQ